MINPEIKTLKKLLGVTANRRNKVVNLAIILSETADHINFTEIFGDFLVCSFDDLYSCILRATDKIIYMIDRELFLDIVDTEISNSISLLRKGMVEPRSSELITFGLHHISILEEKCRSLGLLDVHKKIVREKKKIIEEALKLAEKKEIPGYVGLYMLLQYIGMLKYLEAKEIREVLIKFRKYARTVIDSIREDAKARSVSVSAGGIEKKLRGSIERHLRELEKSIEDASTRYISVERIRRELEETLANILAPTYPDEYEMAKIFVLAIKCLQYSKSMEYKCKRLFAKPGQVMDKLGIINIKQRRKFLSLYRIHIHSAKKAFYRAWRRVEMTAQRVRRIFNENKELKELGNLLAGIPTKRDNMLVIASAIIENPILTYSVMRKIREAIGEDFELFRKRILIEFENLLNVIHFRINLLHSQYIDPRADEMIRIMLPAYMPQAMFFALDSLDTLIRIIREEYGDREIILVDPDKAKYLIMNISMISDFILQLWDNYIREQPNQKVDAHIGVTHSWFIPRPKIRRLYDRYVALMRRRGIIDSDLDIEFLKPKVSSEKLMEIVSQNTLMVLQPTRTYGFTEDTFEDFVGLILLEDPRYKFERVYLKRSSKPFDLVAIKNNKVYLVECKMWRPGPRRRLSKSIVIRAILLLEKYNADGFIIASTVEPSKAFIRLLESHNKVSDKKIIFIHITPKDAVRLLRST